MRFAAFVAPWLLDATVRFIDHAARLPEVDLALITCEPLERLPAHLRARLVAHWRVDDALDPQQIVDALRGLMRQAGRRVERVISVLEQLQVPVAQARDLLRIPGMDAATAANFRDKHLMKERLRAAGLPVARHGLVHGPAEARRFVAQVGFPVVAKPLDGAGAVDTFQLDDPAALERWLGYDPPTRHAPRLLEEFLTGHEFTYDSVMIDRHVVWHSIAAYHPTPLEVLRNPWIQWVVLLPRDISGPAFAPIARAAPDALRALGLHTGLSHMEWFRRPDGSVAISEVGARPPGAGISAALGHAHGDDIYALWPRLMLCDQFTPPTRSHAVGVAYLRGQGTGQIRALHGLQGLQADLGPLIVEANLPKIGHATANTYSGDGWIVVRHPDTAVVQAALTQIIRRVKIDVG